MHWGLEVRARERATGDLPLRPTVVVVGHCVAHVLIPVLFAPP